MSGRREQLTPPSAARRAAEAAARTSYGRLVASLASRYRDIAAAEDALADAFAAALASWPARGVPAQPEGWLLVTAKNALLNRFRHARVHDASAPDLLVHLRGDDDGTEGGDSGWARQDHRLKLLFVCAHPSIDAGMRTPLMLQTVLGLDAERIGSAFLVAPKTMGQRLVRAKAKIKDDDLRFEVPDEGELAERLDDVLGAVYAAYASGWDDLDAGDARGLAEEAIFLGRLLLALVPDEPEVKGLLAVMLFCEARRDARRDDAGNFVPLDRQDATRWSHEMVVEAEGLLTRAAEARRFGRFQCEAAIQSVHAQRAVTGVLQHEALRLLYGMLATYAPSIGVTVGRAAALLDAGDPAAARAILDAIAPGDVAMYQPYWVTASLLAQAEGDLVRARSCLERGIGLTESAPVRAFLLARLAALPASRPPPGAA
jgi:RNA polymerase sigma-70 factor (ECF subfamily)